MNISNREKQQIKSNSITNKVDDAINNTVVTSLSYLHTNSPIPVQKDGINKYKNVAINMFKSNNSKNRIINPAYTKIINYLNDLKNKSNLSTNNQIIVINKNNNSDLNTDLNMGIQNNYHNTAEAPAILTREGLLKSINLFNVEVNNIDLNNLETSTTTRATQDQAVASPATRDSQLGDPLSLKKHTSCIDSLSEEDYFTKTIKQMYNSINEKNKMNELRKSKFIKRLELRKYIYLTKSLYTFKPDLAFNKNVVFKFNKNTPSLPHLTFKDENNSDRAFGNWNPEALNINWSSKVTSQSSFLNLAPVRIGIVQKNINNLYYILKNSFLTFYCIISKPILEITPNKVIIKLFYFNSNKQSIQAQNLSTYKQQYLSTGIEELGSAELNKEQNSNLAGPRPASLNYMLKELEYLCINLSKIMKTSVVLDLVELKSYQLEGHILANSLGIITDKLGRNFRRTVNKIFKKTMIINPAKMKNKNSILTGNKAIALFTGINIKLAGRLSRQSIIPRKTVKIIQRGSLARRYSDFLTVSRYTAKNRRGIFCYTITIGHKFY